MRILWPAKCRVVVKLDTGTGSHQQIINLIGRLKKINKKQQQPNVGIADHVQLLRKLDF